MSNNLNFLPDGVVSTTGTLTFANYWDHFLVRWKFNRSNHRIPPGLYALGRPTPQTEVFVTANYTLSFDALRSSIKGLDAFILVLDTHGINVWCAAGDKLFGTEELINRIVAVGLSQVVTHRNIILPQLSAPGIAAHEVTKRTAFKVEYGPVKAAHLPEYLKDHRATRKMRQVSFSFWDRLVLVPVELVGAWLPLAISFILYFITGSLYFLGTAAAVLTGVIFFPVLLPWIPTANFSTKGFLLGGVAALPFAINILLQGFPSSIWVRAVQALTFFLILPPVTSYLALNFTGATTFTFRTGVKKEIYTFIPVMAWMVISGLLLIALLYFLTKPGS